MQDTWQPITDMTDKYDGIFLLAAPELIRHYAALCSKRTSDGAKEDVSKCDCHCLRCGDGGIASAPHHGNRP